MPNSIATVPNYTNYNYEPYLEVVFKRWQVIVKKKSENKLYEAFGLIN